VRQERSNVNVSVSLLFTGCFGVVDHRYQPVPVVPDIKNDVTIHRIGVLEGCANLIDVVPTDRPGDSHPRFDFVCRIGITSDRFAEVLAGNDVHLEKNTSQYVKLSSVVAKVRATKTSATDLHGFSRINQRNALSGLIRVDPWLKSF
jgi:hypothetical protein